MKYSEYVKFYLDSEASRDFSSVYCLLFLILSFGAAGMRRVTFLCLILLLWESSINKIKLELSKANTEEQGAYVNNKN